jgi:hypothetical protein
VGVLVGAGVLVLVGVGAGVGVKVGVDVGGMVGVVVGVLVGAIVGVGVMVEVGAGVGVLVGVDVGAGVGVMVGVLVGVEVGAGVGVGVGVNVGKIVTGLSLKTIGSVTDSNMLKLTVSPVTATETDESLTKIFSGKNTEEKSTPCRSILPVVKFLVSYGLRGKFLSTF